MRPVLVAKMNDISGRKNSSYLNICTQNVGKSSKHLGEKIIRKNPFFPNIKKTTF